MIDVSKRTAEFKKKLIKTVQERAITVSTDLYDIATNKVAQGSTPVWSGSFLASWNMQIGSPDFTFYVDPYPNPSNPLPPKPTPNLKFDSPTSLSTIYITDAVPYAGKIQREGTTYSNPFILQRITESYRWS
jgi:hypothetical protein